MLVLKPGFLSRSTCRNPTTLFRIRFPEESVLLHMSSLRTDDKPTDFHENPETNHQNGSCKGNTHSSLPRRPPDHASHLGRDDRKVELLPKQKVQSLIREYKRTQHQKTIPIRKLASLIGKIIATANAVFPARLHSKESLQQLNWWIQELPKWNGRSLIPEKPESVVYTDASNSDWSANLNNITIYGKWNQEGSLLHINQLELKAIYFALCAFKLIANQTVLVRTNDTTYVRCLYKSPRRHNVSKSIKEHRGIVEFMLETKHPPTRRTYSGNSGRDRRSSITIEKGQEQLDVTSYDIHPDPEVMKPILSDKLFLLDLHKKIKTLCCY
ncbi:hypothetical protein RclHR1_00870017 [Rhizophagus clarus]|uniref:Reverse transcriptase RNase H-like domain-containing protein n=1 Tax=Rhizophagus clarus TaxID=94130 RepID=A0A2Z6S1Y0_9GLOM|nr:hypothetical protein RclHR1_00870017 [Rhizophagus clarus]